MCTYILPNQKVCVLFFINVPVFLGTTLGGPDPKVGKEPQKCFMKHLFVGYQKQPNCHRWQLFGRWCCGNLFAWSTCLLWWSLRGGRGGGGDPPTQLALGSRETGGQVIQRRSVKGSSLSQPRFGGCANFVTDGLVWLPRPALLKSPCPVSIHQKHVYEPKLGGWAVGIKEKLLLKAEDYKRNNNPASQDDLC